MRRRGRLPAALVACLAVASCTTHGAVPSAGDSTVTRTRTLTRSPAAGVVPFRLAGVAVPPRPAGSPLPPGEVDAPCTYLRAGLNIEPDATGRNFADLEGNRVQRVTRLSTLEPAGCRFYFQHDGHPVGDILPSTYASPADAHDAMVLTAEAGGSARGVPNFVAGVDGVSFRTRLNPPDAEQDWAFAFAKGEIMVVVRTDQTTVSADAEFIAQAIVDRF